MGVFAVWADNVHNAGLVTHVRPLTAAPYIYYSRASLRIATASVRQVSRFSALRKWNLVFYKNERA